MKTDDLITLLAQNEPAPDRAALSRTLLALVVGGVLVSFLFVYFLLQLNPALGTIVASLWFWVRFAFIASLAGLTWWTLRRLGKPGVAAHVRWWPLLVPFVALGLLASVLLMQAPADARLAMLLGTTWRVCSMLIALVSLPLLVAAVLIVRHFAHPPALHWRGVRACLPARWRRWSYAALPELSPAFLVVWYSLGMLIPAAVGAALGERLLRW